MKKFAVLLILLSMFVMPVSAKTCRNGRMTIYHNSEFGYYPNNHVYTDGKRNPEKKVKPVYTYKPISSKPAVSQRPMTGVVR